MRLNNVMKKILAAGLAATMVIASSGLSFAANYPADKQATGTTSKFKKYLLMDKDANIPNVTFTYTIESGEGVPGTATTMEVYAGSKATGTPTIGNAPFSATASDLTKYETQQSGDREGIIADGYSAYAKREVTVDFSSVTFPEPGIYRYKITENNPTASGITYDEKLVRYMDVYVEDTDGKLDVKNYILHEDADTPALNEEEKTDKSDGYVNKYDTKNLIFRKEVSGNQASRDKYFKFTLNITGATAGTKYDVIVTDKAPTENNATTYSAADMAAANNITSLTAESDSVTHDFYLQHGQEIVIKGLAIGTGYEVTEEKEIYTSTPKGVSGYEDETKDTISTEHQAKDYKTSYLNTRNGIIPTGVILDSAPFILIIALAAAALVLSAARKKNR